MISGTLQPYSESRRNGVCKVKWYILVTRLRLVGGVAVIMAGLIIILVIK